MNINIIVSANKKKEKKPPNEKEEECALSRLYYLFLDIVQCVFSSCFSSLWWVCVCVRACCVYTQTHVSVLHGCFVFILSLSRFSFSFVYLSRITVANALRIRIDFGGTYISDGFEKWLFTLLLPLLLLSQCLSSRSHILCFPFSRFSITYSRVLNAVHVVFPSSASLRCYCCCCCSLPKYYHTVYREIRVWCVCLCPIKLPVCVCSVSSSSSLLLLLFCRCTVFIESVRKIDLNSYMLDVCYWSILWMVAVVVATMAAAAPTATTMLLHLVILRDVTQIFTWHTERPGGIELKRKQKQLDKPNSSQTDEWTHSYCLRLNEWRPWYAHDDNRMFGPKKCAHQYSCTHQLACVRAAHTLHGIMIQTHKNPSACTRTAMSYKKLHRHCDAMRYSVDMGFSWEEVQV